MGPNNISGGQLGKSGLLSRSCLFAACIAVSIAGSGPAIAVPTWSSGAKTGIGTAYADYAEPASTVWFSLSRGVVSETMFGMIHETQLKDLLFAVKGDSFAEMEPADMESTISYLDTDASGRPQSLAYRIVNRAKSGRYEIEKHIFTDPKANSLFLRVIFRAKEGAITPTLVVHPGLNGGIGGEQADVGDTGLHVEKGGTHLVLKGLAPFAHESAAEKDGGVELRAELPKVAQGEAVFDLVIGFGHSRAEAEAAADGSLARGHDQVLADYNGGWEHYLAKLSALGELAATAEDGGKLLNVSAMVLKASEDKLHPGALVASLSTPWGDSVPATKGATGYRAVWPRDFYQCAMALLALGDRETPVAALNYLKTVQVGAATPGNKGATGWFLQKTEVDGTPEWVGVQLDQTAMPVMLAWKLWQAGLVDKARLAELYRSSLRPAAMFLADGGKVDMLFNRATITTPVTQQERWEEQPGWSPSTTAAVIAGLTVGGEIASACGDRQGARHFRAAADRIAANIEGAMATSLGVTSESAPNGAKVAARHFLRIAPEGHPDAGDLLQSRNGKPARPEQNYLDAGFLELVRYGVRPAADPVILASLAALDDETLPDDFRVKYEFRFPGFAQSFPGWRRYSDDGYGEDAVSGANFGAETADRLAVNVDAKQTPTQRGRVWPIFTGERGHYQLALAAAKPGGATAADIEAIRVVYVRAMELFANQGLMLPEQVWDGIGANPGGRFHLGAGTGSATPLSWAHAEYVKLLRSLHDRQVWDRYAPVAARYAKR
jgi:glucoamylase